MKAKQHLDKVTELKPFTKIPVEVSDILNVDLGINARELDNEYFWITVLNNYRNCCNSYEDLRNYIIDNSYDTADDNYCSVAELYWPTVKLIQDMVKSGILDKYRG